MKRLIIVFIVLVVSGLFVVVFNRDKTVALPDTSSISTPVVLDNQTYQSQVSRFGAVEVEVIPKNLRVGEEIVFELSLNTHSVELDYEYTSIASLRDNLGDNYKTLNWDGGKSGHHVNGQLTFESLKDGVESVSLELYGIDNQTNIFTWELLE